MSQKMGWSNWVKVSRNMLDGQQTTSFEVGGDFAYVVCTCRHCVGHL